MRLAFALSLFLLGGCKAKPTPTPEQEPMRAESGPPSSASAAPSASAVAAPRSAPTLAPEKFAPKGGEPEALFAVEGALAVVKANRIGRILGDDIEWIGAIPKETPPLGNNLVSSVHGRWPDHLDVLYTSSDRRAPQPSYMPLTGKGRTFVTGVGGTTGVILGVATFGESTLLATYDWLNGNRIMTVRGKSLPRRLQTPTQAGCKEGEVERSVDWPDPPAVQPRAFGGTDSGTLVSVGRLCAKRGAAAELWDESGKSRILDLSAWLEEIEKGPLELLKGKGDELWLYAGPKNPILHYQKGQVEPLPRLERPVTKVFRSASGKLHALAEQTIHRYEGGQWIPFAHFNWRASYTTLAMDDKETLWANEEGTVYRFREAPSVVFHDDCKTPFVFLYDVSPKNELKYTFPSTRKALSSFADAAELTLVEVTEAGARRLGIPVASKAQGEAVIAHVNATMKDEDPKLLCYEAKHPRTIEITTKR